MKTRAFILSAFLCCSVDTGVMAQEKPERWSLQACIDYALANNIQVKRSEVAYQSAQEEAKLAKSQYLPSMAFSTSQTLSNRAEAKNGLSTGSYSSNGSYTGNYGLNASWTVFNGGERYLNVKQTGLQNSIQALAIEEAKDNIELQITQTYLRLLYAYETVKINENTLEVSEMQVKRAEELLKAGSIAKSDLAQLEAECSSDKYQLIVAQTNLDDLKLQLKQLLELDIQEEMDLVYPELSSEQVMQLLPEKTAVYRTALQTMPQIKGKELSIAAARLEKRKAYSGYMPDIQLNASLGSGNVSASKDGFGKQLSNNFNQNLGLSLSVPILDRRQTKTSIQKAKLRITDSELELQNTQKELLSTIESIYLDALSSQTRYVAAAEKVKSVSISEELIREQFNVGMKNTLELLTEKNNLLSARQEMIQAKYMTVMNIQLLNFYQNKPISID